MKHLLNITAIALALLFAVQGCKLATDPDDNDLIDEKGAAVLKGQVIENSSGDPMANVVVRVKSGDFINQAVTTDENGKFRMEVDVEEGIELEMTVFHEGYYQELSQVFAIAGREVEVPPFRLKEKEAQKKESGEPSSIFLVAQTAESIGVKESGAQETAHVTFEVQDSSGNPLDIDHAVDVNFIVGASPGGGEFIHPTKVKTNADGRATVTLNSGTRSGVVQIIAETENDGIIVRSKPVFIAIHGGLPDPAHFSVAREKVNIPGLLEYGFKDRITAYVGDKYSNPVRPGTAVYFKSTGGIIEGSALTNELGEASVLLYSADPQPVHPQLGEGFAVVTASTADELNNNISTEAIVLFSGGASQFGVSPGTFNLANGESQTFTYYVRDVNGNTLTGGTSIVITADGKNVKIGGDVNISLPDALSGWQNFTFTVGDGDSFIIDPEVVTISIEVSVPTSSAVIKEKITFSGTLE